jgi:NIMA (never in mitosis gene a)-related kinase
MIYVIMMLRLKYGKECDIWSMGMIMHELMELEYPYPSNNWFSLMSRVREGKVTPLKQKRSEALIELYKSMIVMVC